MINYEKIITGIVGNTLEGHGFDLIKSNLKFGFSLESNSEYYTHHAVQLYCTKLLDKYYGKNKFIKDIYYKNNGEIVHTIQNGSYLIPFDKLTFIRIIINERDNKNSDNNERITISIFGRNYQRHADRLLNYISKEVNSGTDNRFIHMDGIGMTLRKDFGSVYFKEKEELLTLIRKWENNSEFYYNHGIIHKLGILLHGKPGTGKTSVCRAVANELGYEIAIITNDKYSKIEKEIMGIRNSYPRDKKIIVVLEDIDCIMGNRAKVKNITDIYDDILETSTKNSLLGSMLNVLDGIKSPNNVIFMATTNYIERLDDAFVREGRFDLKYELKYFEKEDAEIFCKMFDVTLEDVVDKETTYPISPAALQSAIINKMKFK